MTSEERAKAEKEVMRVLGPCRCCGHKSRFRMEGDEITERCEKCTIILKNHE